MNSIIIHAPWEKPCSKVSFDAFDSENQIAGGRDIWNRITCDSIQLAFPIFYYRKASVTSSHIQFYFFPENARELLTISAYSCESRNPFFV